MSNFKSMDQGHLKLSEIGKSFRDRSMSPNTPYQDLEAQNLTQSFHSEDESNNEDEDADEDDEDDEPVPILSHSWAPTSVLGASKQAVSAPQTPKFYKSSSIAGPPTSQLSGLPPLHRTISNPSQITKEDLNKLQSFTKNYIIPAAKWAYSPISSKVKPSSASSNNVVKYKIEYSVFKPLRHLRPIKSEKDFIIHWRKIVEDETNEPFDFPANFITKASFNNIIDEVVKVIEEEQIFPERIAAGSSGSYFVYNRNNKNPQVLERVGVFKPKDEEPYGPVSPKWTKWLHRTFFPCFFGRSCLIPNLGYISEAAATVMDQQLLSYIVPHTEVINLRSPTFYYSYFDKSEVINKLPQKIGSFQLFLKGYTESINWLRSYPIPNDVSTLPQTSEVIIGEDETVQDTQFKWSKTSLRQFREEIEKLVILDYIIRNTDRGLDNWMIKIEWILKRKTKNGSKIYTPIVKIGAIDNGLAFPWKRPDAWRSFPFGWLFLPLSIIGQPFSLRTRNHYLPLLTSKFWWEQTVEKLRATFEKDNDFSHRLWLKQLAVLKGQAFNVVEILKLSYAGPLELTRRENLEVIDEVISVPKSVTNNKLLREMQQSIYDIGGYENGYSPYTPRINEEEEEDDDDEEDEEEGEGDSNISEENGHEEIISPISTNVLVADTTPLLAGSPDIQYKGRYLEDINGFEYNLQHDASSNYQERSNTTAVIERIIKANSQPPVFTWC
ncbi:phosphatidyl inositol kinase [Scheffersomyces amazonensis]|uniref:phosphatidyl inositol kinase n=1 Tax=Scheffersomyces amazonensis TaxID=1078765 RepID=UPI00315C556F